MSKAEERANERYPLMQEGDEEMLESLKYVGMECDSVYEYNSIKYSQQAYFIEGYHQAEKDLSENKHEKSWRLDKKLWKGIKDIDEASYQYVYDASNDWAYDVPTWDDVQDAFKAGGEWKEGLELTLEDVKKILALCADIFNERNMHYPINPEDIEEFYQEVLNRFKEYKRQQTNSCKI